MTAGVAFVEVARIGRVLAAAPETAGWLSDSEAARVATLRHPARRQQYLAGHWLTRVVLARRFGGEAAAWSLVERRSLPPVVQDHAETKFVSISHGAEWVAVAVADEPVGIDLEQRPRVLDASLEPLLLEAGEAPGSLDADTLLQRWVAKEAWIKREAGNALPERLARLGLLAVPREHAFVHLHRHDEFHVGLASTAGCVVRKTCDEALVAGAAFRVFDRD